tara:strand:- start:80 stop:457 length:378 start_codon:yes stop_codon:yes gene_type:complete
MEHESKTHILFCIPTAEGAMGPLPHFFALPLVDSGVIYTLTTDIDFFGMGQTEIESWFESDIRERREFEPSSETVSEFVKMFGRFLEKDYKSFSCHEFAYFGFGNMGFCLGHVSMNENPQNPKFQ